MTISFRKPLLIFWLMILALAGCLRLVRQTPTPGPLLFVPTVPVNTIMTATPHPYPWTDEIGVMAGVCFEAAEAVAGQVFIFRSARAHNALYDSVDDGALCRRPVTRLSFDFADGRVLAGLWSPGAGCVARHDVVEIEQDGDQIKRIVLRFVAEGLCDYELLRPFWIGVDATSDFMIEVVPGDVG